MAGTHNPNQNHLLAAMTPAESSRLTPYLDWVPMRRGEVYCEIAGRFPYVYFPTSSVVSLHCPMENGALAEIAAVGNEGMLGISLYMGTAATPCRAFVRTDGYGYKLKAQLLIDEFKRSGPLQHCLLRYTQALITQVSQTAACNRDHSVEQQLCRWLLLTLDRFPLLALNLTQELLAGMLGVQRDEILEAAGNLQLRGFISNRFGRISVLDRSGLEGYACECYNVIKSECEQMLGNGELRPASAGARAMANGRNYFQRDARVW